MIASIEHKNLTYKVDLSNPIDISVPLRGDKKGVNAWYVAPMKIEPVRTDQFLGSVAEGGDVNFRNIFFNPHGNGTHTECVGHIAKEVYSINDTLKTFFFFGQVISVEPEVYVGEETEWQKKGDRILTIDQIQNAIKGKPEAIIIRTLPNHLEKIGHQYSNTNWPYLAEEAAQYISDLGIKHLLIDLPSVDREIDGGKMISHRAFWNYPAKPRYDSTITELIFVPETVADGTFFINIQIASFENDASPSKPLLFEII